MVTRTPCSTSSPRKRVSSGLTYRVVGGVRFYERKEIKDSLAYLKLLMNPHDDVSLRRVINVPPARQRQGCA